MDELKKMQETHVQSNDNLSAEAINSFLAKFRQDNFKGIDMRIFATFIEPDAYPEANTNLTKEPIAAKLLAQFRNEQTQTQAWLILGDSGFGKTTLSYYLCQELWQRYQPGDRIPVYIHLPQIDNLADILSSYLNKRYYEKAECRWLIQQPLLLFLDGFDELPTAKKTNNLYEINKWSAADIKVCYCCRPASLFQYDKVKLFSARTKKSISSLDKYLLATFDKEKLLQYIDKFIAEPTDMVKASTHWQDAHWRKRQTYLDWIEKLPDLKEIIETPFLLSIVMQTLPGIIQANLLQQEHITRASLYKQFIEDWFAHQEMHHADLVKSPELYGLKGELKHYMWIYSQNLAAKLLRDGQITEKNLLEYETLDLNLLEPTSDDRNAQVLNLLQSYVEQDRDYFSGKIIYTAEKIRIKVTEEDECRQLSQRRIAMIRDGCLLRLQDNEFRFIHKSIAEYLAAHSLFVGLGGEYALLLKQAAGNQWRCGLNQQNLREQPEIISRLVEMSKYNSGIQVLYHNLVLNSREIAGLEIAAANAMTILNRLRQNFSGIDLTEVQISGADLRGGQFHQTDFTGANLTDVWFHGSWLSEAIFVGAKLTNTQLGEYAPLVHSEGISHIDIYCPSPANNGDPEGYWMVSCKDGHVYQWSVCHSKIVHKFNIGNKVKILSIAVDSQQHKMIICSVNDKKYSDRKHLLSDSYCQIGIWNIQKQKLLKTYRMSINNLPIGLSFDNLYSIDWDSLKIALNINTSHLAMTFNSMSSNDLTEHPIYIWNIEEGKCLGKLGGHGKIFKKFIWHPQGKQLATISNDNNVYLWDLERFKLIKTLDCQTMTVKCLAYHPDGNQLAVGGKDPAVLIWDVESAEIIQQLQIGEREPPIKKLVFSSEGKQLATKNTSKIYLWNLINMEIIRKLEGHTFFLRKPIFHPHSKLLATISNTDTVLLWSVEQMVLFQEQQYEHHAGCVKSVAYQSNGKQIATGSCDQTVKIWDGDNGEIKQVLTHDINVHSVAYCPESNVLASASVHGVTIWDVQTASIMRKIEISKSCVLHLGYHPVRNLLVGITRNEIYLWDLDNDQTNIIKGEALQLQCFTFHPNAKQLITGSKNGRWRLWDLTSNQLKATVEAHSKMITCMIVTANDNHLVTGGEDMTLRLWDIERSKIIREFRGHAHAVSSVAYHHADHNLISGSRDKTFRIWNYHNGNCIRTISYFEPILSLALDQAGKNIFVGFGANVALFQYQQNVRHPNKPNLLLKWRTGATKGYFSQIDLTQAIDCHSNTESLLSFYQAIGRPAQPNSIYQAWFELFKPIEGTASHENQATLVETHKRLTVNENRWVVSVARQLKGSRALHAFLIIEGVLQQRRFIIRAELTSPNRKQVIIMLTPIHQLADFQHFQASVNTYEAQQWDIPADCGRELLRNIRADQRKALRYSQAGGGAIKLDNEFFNCVSWCIKQLRQLNEPEINIKEQWYHFFVVPPQSATQENRPK